MFGINRYIVYAAGALTLALLLWGGIAHWKSSIRKEEAGRIELEQMRDAAKKQLKGEVGAQKAKEIVDELTPDELAEYFRSGKLPERTNRKGGNAPSSRSPALKVYGAGQERQDWRGRAVDEHTRREGRS